MHVALSAIRSLQDSNVKGQAAIPDCTNAKNTNYRSFCEVAYGELFLLTYGHKIPIIIFITLKKRNHKTPKKSVLGCVK